VIKLGREFLDIFESWAESYDHSVSGKDEQYREVFRNYEAILEEVALLSHGDVIEFGAGTGNLTEKLLEKGHKVTAIEPSKAMKKLFQKKMMAKSNVTIMDGDFLEFPVPNKVDTIVSTYAFHHLTDEEKAKAISIYRELLKTGGKVVFADTMFPSKADHKQAIEKAKAAHYDDLAHDLQTEYYTTIPYLQNIMTANDFQVKFKQWNDFVWIMEAVKQ
jgi:putative AdoMet-dependent methyltransferase